jgi:hypothetical protein
MPAPSRFRKRFGNFILIAILAVIGLLVALGLVTYATPIGFTCWANDQGEVFGVYSEDGYSMLFFSSVRSAPAPRTWKWDSGDFFVFRAFGHREPRTFSKRTVTCKTGLPFHIHHVHDQRGFPGQDFVQGGIQVHGAVPVIVMIGGVVLIYRKRIRRWRRIRKNLCPTCGYDRRGNISDICPECGESVEATDRS